MGSLFGIRWRMFFEFHYGSKSTFGSIFDYYYKYVYTDCFPNGISTLFYLGGKSAGWKVCGIIVHIFKFEPFIHTTKVQIFCRLVER